MQYKPEGISKKVFYQVRTFTREMKLYTQALCITVMPRVCSKSDYTVIQYPYTLTTETLGRKFLGKIKTRILGCIWAEK